MKTIAKLVGVNTSDFGKDITLLTQVTTGEYSQVLEQIKNGANPLYKNKEDDKSVIELLIENNQPDIAIDALNQYSDKLSPKSITFTGSPKTDSTIADAKNKIGEYYNQKIREILFQTIHLNIGGQIVEAEITSDKKTISEEEKVIQGKVRTEETDIKFLDFLHKDKLVFNEDSVKLCLKYSLEALETRPYLLEEAVGKIITTDSELVGIVKKQLIDFSNDRAHSSQQQEAILDLINSKNLTIDKKDNYLFKNLPDGSQEHLKEFEKLKKSENSIPEAEKQVFYEKIDEVYTDLSRQKLPKNTHASLRYDAFEIFEKQEKELIDLVAEDPSKFEQISTFFTKKKEFEGFIGHNLSGFENPTEENYKNYLQTKIIDKISKDKSSSNEKLVKLLEQDLDLTLNQDEFNFNEKILDAVIDSAKTNPTAIHLYVSKIKNQLLTKHSNSDEKQEELNAFANFVIEKTSDKDNTTKENFLLALKTLEIDSPEVGYKIDYALLNTEKGKDPELLNHILETYPDKVQNISEKLDFTKLKILHDNGHTESLNTLLSSNQFNRYLDQAIKENADKKFISYMLENKGENKLSPKTDFNFLIDKALELNDDQLLNNVINEVNSYPERFKTHLEYLKEKSPGKYEDILKSCTPEVGESILEKTKIIDELDPVINKPVLEHLVISYNPEKTPNSKFFGKLVVSQYSPSETINGIMTKLENNFTTSNNQLLGMFTDSIKKSIENYYDRQRKFEKKPFISALTAVFRHGMSPKKYKERKLNGLLQQVEDNVTNYFTAGAGNIDKAAENAAALEQAVEIKIQREQEAQQKAKEAQKKKIEELEEANIKHRFDTKVGKGPKEREETRDRIENRQAKRRIVEGIIDEGKRPVTANDTPSKQTPKKGLNILGRSS